MRAALRTVWHILRPGGVALVTAPGISQIADRNWRDSWFWGFLRLLGEIFKWLATGLLTLQIVSMFWGVLFGRPETYVRGRTGIFGNRRY